MKHKCKTKSKYEVLAPAGSYKCMVAAFNAGADAVYLGGSMFGARASADNFTDDELLSAIEYAHLRDKKVFLTVNTLLKNVQIEQQLYDYIKPLYEAGLDAVIVQDLGVLRYIRKYFPDIDIHASTQMTVTGKEFSKELKELGVSRIVPARELSLGEIEKIYKATNLEIECFVHGALCYCYSGACLFSSIIGGRSGNRGRCAQPCRLPYDVLLNDKHIDGEYPISPADLCTLNILPDILEAGVYSLKIEGRMKKPEYVAIVTAMYRKYVDMYENYGREGYKVNKSDIEKLMDIYNRGEFTEGYYKRHNGKELMSVKRPNHTGTKAAIILNYDKSNKTIQAKACEELHADDVLEIFLGNGESISVNSVDASENETFYTRIKSDYTKRNNVHEHKNINISENRYIMRTRNNKLIADITEKYVDNNISECVSIGGSVVIHEGIPVAVDVWYRDINVHVEGNVPAKAQNRPISEEDVLKQITKTGGTEFVFSEDDLSILLGEGLFVNIKELNQLRREALEELKEKIASTYKRKLIDEACDDAKISDNITGSAIKNLSIDDIGQKAGINIAYVTTMAQFDVVVTSNKPDAVCFEADIVDDNHIKKWNELISVAHNNKKEIFMCLPYIFREHGIAFFREHIDFFKNSSIDGYVFRNMEEICTFEAESIDRKKAIFDNTIYSFNNYAVEYLEKYKPYLICMSAELNEKELMHLNIDNAELCVYGNIPVMITAGCIKKTYGSCDRQQNITIIRDRYGNDFSCVSNCRYCYNVIYNSRPLWLADIVKNCSDKYKAFKYVFTTETPEEVENILNGYQAKEYTRGHYKRGVE